MTSQVSKYLSGDTSVILEAIPDTVECFFMGTRMTDDYFTEVVLPQLPEKPLMWSSEKILNMLESAGYNLPTNIPSILNAVRDRQARKEREAREARYCEEYRRIHFPTKEEQQADRDKMKAKAEKANKLASQYHRSTVEANKASVVSKASGSYAFLDD